MATYASKTEVPIEKSKMEIERIVRRYGATGFASGWQGTRATLQFLIGKDAASRHIRFSMDLPDPKDQKFRFHSRGLRSQESAEKEWEQACRQKWRALALLVKAKLEAVDAKISTIEESFFADIVMPDGRTVYESARENVRVAYEKREPVLLLGN